MIEAGTGAALSVTELNEYARRLMAGDPLLRNLEVTGEISGYKHHSSGHRYFSLKDEASRVQCVMFREHAMALDFRPEDGMQVTVRGAASLFVRDGSYQLYVRVMRRAGQGDLLMRFEQLKRRLMAEGLFDPARKRPLPLLPKVIGVATSETGAALRDILRVARRRDPNVGVIVAPCAVQGAAAAGEIVEAIRRLNADGRSDVILVGRGGGSIEDLWAFNEEPVARAIAASRIPVISCVGHEVDFTIADFVADVRAATPSMAAELAVPEREQLRVSLAALLRRLSASLENGQRVRRMRWERLCASRALAAPDQVLLEPRRAALDALGARLAAAGGAMLDGRRRKLDAITASLRAMNPEAVLARGYAIVTGPGGALLTSAKGAKPGDAIGVRLSDGTLTAHVDTITLNEDQTHGE